MVIKTWSQPIHEHQEGEVGRERTYLEQFFIFPGNLMEYADFVDYVYKKLHAPELHQNCTKYEKIFQDVYKSVFVFDAYDLKKGHAPKVDQFKKWSAGINCSASEKYTWKQIRTSFRNDFFKDRMEDVSLVVSDALVEVANDTVFLIRENKKVVKKEIANGTYTPNKSEAASKSQKNNTDVLLQISGKDSKTVNADVKLNAEVEAGVETNIKIEDNQALATVQAMFMQPEFVEMNRKLMEKTADELQKRRRNSDE